METKNIKKTASTLLIPKKDLEALYLRIKNKKMNLKEYLEFLLRRYRDSKGVLTVFASQKMKKQYQAKGLDLQRRNFIPENDSWQELSQLSASLGLSKTFMFMILFYLDVGIIEIPENSSMSGGVPTQKRANTVLILYESLNLTQKTYTRGLRLLI